MLSALALVSGGCARSWRSTARHSFSTARTIFWPTSPSRRGKRSAASQDGHYDFWDYLDDDLVTPFPGRIRVRISAADGLITLDFDGTDPQTLSSFNVPTLGTRHPWLSLRLVSLAMTLDPSIPVNSGILDNVTIKAPEGSILNPRFPAATGVRHATAIRVDNVLVGALAKALPDVMPACSGGIVIPIVFAENDPADRQFACHRRGARGRRHGRALRLRRHRWPRQQHRESREQSDRNDRGDASLRIVEYGLRPDSGGAGRWRGGNGVAITFRDPHGPATVLGRGMERFRFSRGDFRAARPEHSPELFLTSVSRTKRDLGKIDSIMVKRGDRFTILTPGAGGYGNPFERLAEQVADDVRKGFVTADAALRQYGVVLTVEGIVDAAKTGAPRANPPKPIRPIRRAMPGMKSFPTPYVTALNRQLYGLPPGPANHRRSRIFARVLDGLDAKGIASASQSEREAPARAVLRLGYGGAARLETGIFQTCRLVMSNEHNRSHD